MDVPPNTYKNHLQQVIQNVNDPILDKEIAEYGLSASTTKMLMDHFRSDQDKLDILELVFVCIKYKCDIKAESYQTINKMLEKIEKQKRKEKNISWIFYNNFIYYSCFKNYLSLLDFIKKLIIFSN